MDRMFTVALRDKVYKQLERYSQVVRNLLLLSFSVTLEIFPLY